MLKFFINKVLKDTLRLKIYGHESRYVLILPSRLENYHSQKKCDSALQRTLHQNRYFTFVTHFFFSQKKLVFKSNPVFIDIFNSFWYSSFTFFSFDFYLYFTDFEVDSMPLCLFYKHQWSFHSQNVMSYFPWDVLTCWQKTALNGENNSWR